MKINRDSLYLEMARNCISLKELSQKAELPTPSLKNAVCGRNIRPATAGKIARALGVDVTELLEDNK